VRMPVMPLAHVRVADSLSVSVSGSLGEVQAELAQAATALAVPV